MPFRSHFRSAAISVSKPAFICTLILAFAGCGGNGGPERIVVIGTVTLDDVPIQRGNIWFIPEEGQDLPQAGGTIESGIYRIENKGGVPLGEHSVRIFGEEINRDVKVVADGGPEQIPMEQFVPPEFNTDTNLTATVVKAEPPLIIDFALESEPTP